MTYQEFLQQKQKSHIKSGFDVAEDALSAHLFDFQRFIVKRALAAAVSEKAQLQLF